MKVLVITLTSVMIAGTAVPVLPIEAATQDSIGVSNKGIVYVVLTWQ